MGVLFHSDLFAGSVQFPQFCLLTTKIWSNGPALPSSDGPVLQLLDRPVLLLLDGPVLLLRGTAQFYLKNKGKYILQEWGHANQKDMKRRERERDQVLWLLFYMFFLLPLGLPYVNWGSQECCLFYLRSSLWSSDLALFYFWRLFPSLSFRHHHSGLLCPILTT